MGVTENEVKAEARNRSYLTPQTSCFRGCSLRTLLRIYRDGRQQKLAQEIEQISHRNGVSVSVLLLGTFSDQIHTDEWWKAARDHTSEYIGARYNIGLIMAIGTEDKGHVWRRLGICIWDLTQLASISGVTAETDFLEGRTSQWQHMEGLFG